MLLQEVKNKENDQKPIRGVSAESQCSWHNVAYHASSGVWVSRPKTFWPPQREADSKGKERMKRTDIGEVVSNASVSSHWHLRRDLTDLEGCLIWARNLSPVTSYVFPNYLFFIRCWPNLTIHISLNLTSHRNRQIQATAGNGKWFKWK